jgi:hypothetical protein
MWSKQISRYKLFEDLKARGIGNGHDLPLDLSLYIPEFPCYQRDRKTLVENLNVEIFPSSGKNRGHRIYVQCPKCGDWVPFGRYHQHWSRKDHQ